MFLGTGSEHCGPQEGLQPILAPFGTFQTKITSSGFLVPFFGILASYCAVSWYQIHFWWHFFFFPKEYVFANVKNFGAPAPVYFWVMAQKSFVFLHIYHFYVVRSLFLYIPGNHDAQSHQFSYIPWLHDAPNPMFLYIPLLDDTPSHIVFAFLCFIFRKIICVCTSVSLMMRRFTWLFLTAEFLSSN